MIVIKLGIHQTNYILKRTYLIIFYNIDKKRFFYTYCDYKRNFMATDLLDLLTLVITILNTMKKIIRVMKTLLIVFYIHRIPISMYDKHKVEKNCQFCNMYF